MHSISKYLVNICNDLETILDAEDIVVIKAVYFIAGVHP